MSQAALDSPLRRHIYMVLSSRALPYARCCLDSLLRNSLQPLHIHLITDDHEDKLRLVDVMGAFEGHAEHCWEVIAQVEMLDCEGSRFDRWDNLRALRRGHPCWRKITDPLLLGESGQELIMLDPDVYFPNLFQFEATPESGLLLMFQRPNCLLPPDVVLRAFDAGLSLADHVDIGVAHWRGGQDIEWLDWLIGRLGGKTLPPVMHVEAIIWAAVAMREGGGYLDPRRWICWRRTQWTRIRQKLGASGENILRSERWDDMKCLHCGGVSKWWLPECSPELLRRREAQVGATRIFPFVEYTRNKFAIDQKARSILRRTGYYKLLGSY